MGNPHQVIVNHIGQMICGQPVGFQQNLRINLPPVQFDATAQHVFNFTAPLAFGHDHTDNIGRPRRVTALHFFVAQLQVGRL